MNDLVDQRLIGIPYKIGGKTAAGADCVGVAVMWLRSKGIMVDYKDGKGPISSDWWAKSPRRFMESLLEVGHAIRFQDVKKYDCLLLFGNEQCLYPSSLAVMVDDRHILTASEARGSFCEILSESWKAKFWGAIRLNAAKGVD